MTEFPILRDLAQIVLAAGAVLLLVRRGNVPPLVGYIIAGLVLGPATGLIAVTESVDLIAEVGIALLLFLVGLELSLDKVRDIGRAAAIGGGLQIAFTALGGYALGALLGFTGAAPLLLALTLTFSSTVVVVKLLEREGAIASLHGRLAIGILLVQDVVVAVVLTLLVGLGSPDAVEPTALAGDLLGAFAGMAGLVAVALIGARHLLPPAFRWLAGSIEATFILSLAWCFAFIAGAAALGLSVEIGAFVAGVSMAQLHFGRDLVRRVQPLVNFFLAVFFVTLGIHLAPRAALARWPVVTALVLFTLVGKPALLMAILPRLGYDERTAFRTAISLGETSEFSFIVATIGLSVGLVDRELLSIIGAVGLVTIGTAAVLIQNGDAVYDRVRRTGALRMFRAPPGVAEPRRDAWRDHIIIVGMNALGLRLVDAFARRGETVLAIDSDPAKLAGLPCPTLHGDVEHHSVLEEAGLPRATLLVSALQIEDTNNLLAYRARRHGIRSSIHAFDPSLIEELRELGATHLMISKREGARRITAELHAAGLIG